MLLALVNRATSLLGSARAERTEAVDVGQLFAEHSGFLLRCVERMTGPGSHVEDIVQEVFLTAHQKRGSLPPRADCRRWLFGVARNLIHHHRRSFVRRQRLGDAVMQEPTPAGSPQPDALLENLQHGLLIRRAVLMLPVKYREVFVLYELEELDGRDIAQLLDVADSTVWLRLKKAREMFTDAVKALSLPGGAS